MPSFPLALRRLLRRWRRARFCGALQFAARRERVASAGEAADADVRADTLDAPLDAAARVALSQRDEAAEPQLYGHALPIRSSSALIASRRRAASARAAAAKSAPGEA